MKPFFSPVRSLLVAAACGVALLGAISANAANPPIFMTHGVEYMSGGIGADEAELMQVVSPRWAATFEFAVKDHKGADLAANVHVTVRDKSGTALLDNVVSGGPYFVARLEPGEYEVEAQLGGQSLKQPLQIMAGAPAKATFLFPLGADVAPSVTAAAPTAKP
jgi:hypothetical protein